MSTADLATLLQRRLKVIADHGWRERDPAGQLASLVEVSIAIQKWHDDHAQELSPRLRHFLENASYDKALAWIES